MRLRACVLALIAWAVLSMQPAFAQSAASAQRFLQTVYSAYTFNGDPPGIEAAGSHAIASPSLLQLIRKGQRAWIRFAVVRTST
jgi:uncharacterized membrane protein (DUF2068 family)